MKTLIAIFVFAVVSLMARAADVSGAWEADFETQRGPQKYKRRDSVKMVTFWGANDANSWRAQGKPLMFDGDSKPKPAFEAVIAEAKKADEK